MKLILIMILSFTSYGQDLTSKPDFDFIETMPNGAKLRETTWLKCGSDHNKAHYEDIKRKIGWVYATNCQVRVTKKNKNNIGYDVTYKINSLGLRETPQSAGKKSKHLIIAGDSNTFGQGLPDDETLSYLLGKKFTQYEVFNFGQRGAGPNNTLALLDETDWKTQIKEQEGRMLYMFYPAWMSVRVYGSKDFITVNRGNSPWYEIEDDDTLIRKGNLRDKWMSKVFLGISLIDPFHWIGDLPKQTFDHVKLIAKVIITLKDKYLESFPKGTFTLVLSDYKNSTRDFIPELITLLKNGGVEVVIINKSGWQEDSKLHGIDEHMNLEGTKVLQNALEKVISFQ